NNYFLQHFIGMNGGKSGLAANKYTIDEEKYFKKNQTSTRSDIFLTLLSEFHPFSFHLENIHYHDEIDRPRVIAYL
ncbi:hypothetical protein L9F63_002715, partial [Diploptera punctata]